MSVNIDDLTKEVFKQSSLNRKNFVLQISKPDGSTGAIPPGLDANLMEENYNKVMSSDPNDQQYIQNLYYYNRLKACIQASLSTLEAGIPSADDIPARAAYQETLLTKFHDAIVVIDAQFVQNPDIFSDTQRLRDENRLDMVLSRRQNPLSLSDEVAKQNLLVDIEILLEVYTSLNS